MITRICKTSLIISLMLSILVFTSQAQPNPQQPAQETDAKKTATEPQNATASEQGAKPDAQAGSKADRGLSRLENNKLVERIKPYFNHPYLHPRFGGIGDGSGFGLGVELTNDVKNSPNFQLSALIQGTLREYLRTTAGISFDPSRQGREHFQFDLMGRYELRPRENFYGLGPDSLRSNRSNYNLQERGFNATAIFKLTKSLRVGAGLDFSSTRIFAGKNNRYEQTATLFPTLPGLARGASLLSPQVFIEFDQRDKKRSPTKGVFANFTATSSDSVGKDDFGFVNLRFDTRGYLPLGTPRHVLAARLIGTFNEAKGGSQIPFFRLAHLGDSQTLRGYRSFRFYGRNALAANIEYRAELIPAIGAMAFTDFGQVFDQRSQLTTQNLHATFGGGFEFKAKKATLFRVLVGKSGEGTRVILGFGPTF